MVEGSVMGHLAIDESSRVSSHLLGEPWKTHIFEMKAQERNFGYQTWLIGKWSIYVHLLQPDSFLHARCDGRRRADLDKPRRVMDIPRGEFPDW